MQPLLKPGSSAQHPTAGHWRLEEKVSEVPGKHLDGMRFTVFGDLPPELPLEAGQNEPRDRVPNTALEEFGMRMAGRHEHLLGGRLHFIHRPVDPNLEQFGPLAPVDRQHAVRRNPLDMLRVVEEVAKVLFVF